MLTGDNPEELAELTPEQAVVKLQRQNVRLRCKAEAAMALEQENATLKSQLQEVANQMVRYPNWMMQYLNNDFQSFWTNAHTSKSMQLAAQAFACTSTPMCYI